MRGTKGRHYPRWWDTTITLYNRYENPETNIVTWYSKVIDRCFLKRTYNKTVSGEAVFETNNVILRMPQRDDFKHYSEWMGLPEDDRGKYMTLHQGDIVIAGEVDDGIDEYVHGMRSTDLIAKYRELGLCVVINSYQDNSGSRCAPHYFVSGE